MIRRPLFSFYGSKFRAAKLYPPPAHSRLIEPFAGSAGYACLYHQLAVHLYDISPEVCGVWDFLIHASRQDILDLPITHDPASAAICQEAKWLIGFWISRASEYPRTRPSSWAVKHQHDHGGFWDKNTRAEIADSVELIRHWRVHNSCYSSIINITAAWFIDPPYSSKAGRSYRSGRPDFSHLAAWSQSRRGQVIVCEHNSASWLPFSPLFTAKSCNGKGKHDQTSRELIWTNS